MKKYMPCFVLALILEMSIGCGHSPTPPIISNSTGQTDTVAKNAQLIRLAASQSVALGLSAYASDGHQAEAVAIATKMRAIVTSSALPYFAGATGAPSAMINAFINGQFVELPGIAQSVIGFAASILDSYVPAPAAGAYLSADQVTYIKAFFQGLDDGAVQFLASPLPATKAMSKDAPVAIPNGKWFNILKN